MVCDILNYFFLFIVLLTDVNFLESNISFLSKTALLERKNPIQWYQEEMIKRNFELLKGTNGGQRPMLPIAETFIIHQCFNNG
jgi:hypothetical protein